MKIDKEIYQGKVYPVRILDIVIDGEPREVRIAPESLGDELEKFDDLDGDIDNRIYFYVVDAYMVLSDKELAQHLDQSFSLVEHYEGLSEYDVQGEIPPIFPNGFESWYETHHEIVAEITKIENMREPFGAVKSAREEKGIGGLYELAKELTDRFERENMDRDWGGEFFDEMELFLTKNLR